MYFMFEKLNLWLFSNFSNNFFKYELKSFHAYRLGEYFVYFVLPGLFDEFFLNVTGACNYHRLGHLVVRVEAPNLQCGLVAIHDRHADVREN